MTFHKTVPSLALAILRSTTTVSAYHHHHFFYQQPASRCRITDGTLGLVYLCLCRIDLTWPRLVCFSCATEKEFPQVPRRPNWVRFCLSLSFSARFHYTFLQVFVICLYFSSHTPTPDPRTLCTGAKDNRSTHGRLWELNLAQYRIYTLLQYLTQP